MSRPPDRLPTKPDHCYGDDEDGDVSPVLPANEGPPAAGADRARAHGIPDIDELAELNRAIHQDDGLPGAYALDQRAPLLDCLNRAAAVYDPSPHGIIATAAVLAHGVAQAQAFRDGNRRTAYFATQAFLHRHNLGYLSGEDDDMLARKLNQVVERQSLRTGRHPPEPRDFEDLFRRRHEHRTPPA